MTAEKNKEFSISVILVVGLLLAVGLIYLFVFSVAENGFGKNMERVNMQPDSNLAMRIKPVVTLEDILGEKTASGEELPEVAAKLPKELYDGACMACHSSGVAGAPKLGDGVAWGARYEVGLDALLSSAIAGKGAMPPNGGTTYSKDEIRSVIEFMLTEAGLMEAATATPVAAAVDLAPVAAAAPAAVSTVREVETPEFDLVAGEKAYRAACFACHDTGAAGAPMLGDRVAWSPRISMGFDSLLHSVLNGKGAMPPKGGATYFADSEVANIVAFMLSKAE